MNALYDIIGIPFGYLMQFINYLCKNYAVSIIVFTIVTKIIFLPVNYKTQKNAARMQLLNPKLEKLRKSFKNNPQRLQEEQQKLYIEEGINPMGSCLPAFIQMFLVFGVLDVVYKPITHILRISKSVRKQACEIAGVKSSDLRSELRIREKLAEAPEKFQNLGENFADRVNEFYDNFNVFGANLAKYPSLSPDTWNREAVILALIPFLAGLAQLLSSVYSQIRQKKMNPNLQGQGCMTAMMYLMPLLSIWFAFKVPAGIGFYWIWSALFSFVITFALNQYFTPERTEAINEKEKEKARIYAEKHPEKKTFMQRMMEQQELMNQQQNGGNNNQKSNKNDKISRSEMNKYNRDKIKEARRKMAEKYGDAYDDSDNED
ncbi:YidC/Oxa1 family membrane protein insertase [Ruminococcus sp.]|uniref:YidC/Oxa1 family membrane protein insertase n=1 Tax=Ruminococcus sp. TaxID=41978 RepID=UPI0025DE8644|nr:YidC/Oxa1 family membrane protein insertase [Ruminococcus sp.]MCR4639976.1 YidC/Oxa1 family membrane protein insertase [Ruminococcus sp.]